MIDAQTIETPAIPMSELGRELFDIVNIAATTHMPMEQIHAAILGRVGVNASCWQAFVNMRAKNSPTRPDLQGQE